MFRTMPSTSPLEWPVRYRILSILAFLLLVFGSVMAIRLVMLTADANRFCGQVQERYEGDLVEIMIACLEDHTQSLDNRNHAVWFLGQADDSRALPALKAHLTGEPCDHARAVCQYELEKAIGTIEDGRELSKLWRVARNFAHPAFRDL